MKKVLCLTMLMIFIASSVFAVTEYVKKDDYTVTKTVTVTVQSSDDLDTANITRDIARIDRQITEAQQRITALQADRVALVNVQKLIVAKPAPEEIIAP